MPRHDEDDNGEGDMTPTAENIEPSSKSADTRNPSHTTVLDAVVEIIITHASSIANHASETTKRLPKSVSAKMIITIWELDDERYYTLTFTSTDSNSSAIPSTRVQSRQVKRREITRASSSGGGSRTSVSSPSSSSGSIHGSNKSSTVTSPTTAPMSLSPFPPLGPPGAVSDQSTTTAFSHLQKVIMMKDALLDTTEVPILAMWADESVAIPNRAARRLFSTKLAPGIIMDGAALVSQWNVYDEDFKVQLQPSEYPIAVLIRTQTPFANKRVGMLDPESGKKIILDVLGEAITGDNGEFLAGLISCRDVTAMSNKLAEQVEKDEQRFRLICESLPQMVSI